MGLRGAGWLAICVGCNPGLTFYEDPVSRPGPTDGTEDSGGTDAPEVLDSASLPDTPTGDSGTPTSTVPAPTGDTGEPPPPPPWINGDAAIPPPYLGPPPVELPNDCATLGAAAFLDDDRVDVLADDGPLEERILTSPIQGWYDLYGPSMADSGLGEANESALFRVANPINPSGLPVVTNCDLEWAAVDNDNFVTPGDVLVYLGTFWFEAGDNDFAMEHLCPTILLGQCTNLEELSDPDTVCSQFDGNSLELQGDSLCLVTPTP